jgi:uncharacterized protein
MNHARVQLAPGLVADVRRALWLEEERTLVVADLHLGYAWAHRHGGQLLPLSVEEDTADRLAELQRDYRPREIILLGDVVHRTVPVPALESILRDVIQRLSLDSAVTVVRGNHDGQLDQLLVKVGSLVKVIAESRIGKYLLIHGDQPAELQQQEFVIMGHEHPAFWLDDGVASGAKCPCFLMSENVLVLPAFSRWAAGTEVGRQEFLSALARSTKFTTAVALVADRLLPVPLQ